MTEERFEDLAAAYGAEIGRWPEAEREAAALFLAERPDTARAVLAREDGLDAALDALPRYPAPAELFERIVAAAPAARSRKRRSWRSWLVPAGLSATLVATTAVGVILGAQFGERAVGSQQATTATAELDVSGLAGDV